MRAEIIATICVGLVALLAALALLAAAYTDIYEGFYTRWAREEPTRSYVPYVGTAPRGTWGAEPWAEVVPAPPRVPSRMPWVDPINRRAVSL